MHVIARTQIYLHCDVQTEIDPQLDATRLDVIFKSLKKFT